MSHAPFTMAPQQSGRYTLYSKPEYFKALAQAVTAAKPGQRVLVTAMTFKQSNEPFDPLAVPVFKALEAAAQRGVQAFFSIDAHEFLIHGRMQLGPLWFSKVLPGRLPRAFAAKLACLESLRRAGVHVGITNQPGRRFSNPYGGRSHIKAAIVDDLIFVGGCNLSDAGELDLMVCWRDKRSADWLFTCLQRMILTQSTGQAFGGQDLLYDAGQNASLIIDAGSPHQSLIYQHALDAIDRAREWLVITCQYFPNGKTGQALKRAHQRGVVVRPIFNHPSQHIAPQSLPHYAVKHRERLRVPRAFFTGELSQRTPFLHAKLIASEQEAMIGSHNYVTAGVNFGTAEIALHAHQPDVAKTAAKFMVELTGQGENPNFAFLQSASQTT